MKEMRLLSLLLTVFGVTIGWAQGPNNTKTYYQNADGLKGKALKTAMSHIINKGAKDNGYDGLYRAYVTTDVREDGTIWDIYSNTTRYSTSKSGSSANSEGIGWNREHTVPQSWFDKASPMRNDVFHVYPTDIYINSMRGSYPYGEVNHPTKTSQNGFSKLGPCSTPGYSKTVFEPADEYKGDLARTYFYMATRYEDRIGSWTKGESVFGKGSYPGIEKWQLDLLMKWAKNDPVSPKEIARNNAAYAYQNNRNPFIDYPGLEQYVWGDSVNVAFSYSNYGQPGGTPNNPDPTDPQNPTVPQNPTDPQNPVDPTPITPIEGQAIFTKVVSLTDLQPGKQYLIVSETDNRALGASAGSYRNYAEVTITNGNTIQTSVNNEGEPRALVLGGTTGSYTFYDSVDNAYLSLNANANNLHSIISGPSGSPAAQWSISIESETMKIANNKYPTRFIKYNSSSPRFATYSSSSASLKFATLYQVTTTTGISLNSYSLPEDVQQHVYTIEGVLVRKAVSVKEALQGLPKGLYVVGGRKYVVK